MDVVSAKIIQLKTVPSKKPLWGRMQWFFSVFFGASAKRQLFFHSLVVIQPNQHAANQQLVLMGILQLQCLMAGFPFHYERVVQEQRTSTWLVIIYFEVLEVQGSTHMFFQDVLNLMCLEVFQQW